MNVLGVHFGHDANAALIQDGQVVAEVQEERFNRVKHSGDPPLAAVAYCLEAAGVGPEDVHVLACSGRRRSRDFPVLFVPRDGEDPLAHSLPTHARRLDLRNAAVDLLDHHRCHAAAAYFLSGSREAALICVSDGQGDETSVSFWRGEGERLDELARYPIQGSLGWFYSNVTEALGWEHGDGEGKTMALASNQDPAKALAALRPFCPGYRDDILTAPRDFGPVGKLVLRGTAQWHLRDATAIQALLAVYSRGELAAAAQQLLEDEHVALACHWLARTGLSRLCLGGGVFLNIILNRRLADLSEVDELFIYPNPGDPGLGLGAALGALAGRAPGELPAGPPSCRLGPGYDDEALGTFLRQRKLAHRRLDEASLCAEVAELLARGKCVGWFQGRMEAGPRALGGRSILMSPARVEYKDYVNAMVKFREPFRPFCPSLIEESRQRYLVEREPAPYMILGFTAPETVRSSIEGVVHVDGTLRPQVVSRRSDPLYHRLIAEFERRTGLGIVMNTSLNIKGEPIVCTPADAVRCYASTGLDALALGGHLLVKEP